MRFCKVSAAIRYGIPTAIIFWNAVEIAGRWHLFTERWERPWKFALERSLVTAACIVAARTGILQQITGPAVFGDAMLLQVGRRIGTRLTPDRTVESQVAARRPQLKHVHRRDQNGPTIVREPIPLAATEVDALALAIADRGLATRQVVSLVGTQ